MDIWENNITIGMYFLDGWTWHMIYRINEILEETEKFLKMALLERVHLPLTMSQLMSMSILDNV